VHNKDIGDSSIGTSKSAALPNESSPERHNVHNMSQPAVIDESNQKLPPSVPTQAADVENGNDAENNDNNKCTADVAPKTIVTFTGNNSISNSNAPWEMMDWGVSPYSAPVAQHPSSQAAALCSLDLAFGPLSTEYTTTNTAASAQNTTISGNTTQHNSDNSHTEGEKGGGEGQQKKKEKGVWPSITTTTTMRSPPSSAGFDSFWNNDHSSNTTDSVVVMPCGTSSTTTTTAGGRGNVFEECVSVPKDFKSSYSTTAAASFNNNNTNKKTSNPLLSPSSLSSAITPPPHRRALSSSPAPSNSIIASHRQRRTVTEIGDGKTSSPIRRRSLSCASVPTTVMNDDDAMSSHNLHPLHPSSPNSRKEGGEGESEQQLTLQLFDFSVSV
jgi:hypothetical protein